MMKYHVWIWIYGLLLCVSLCCIKAEKKPKVENLCRSVGGLKFDSTQTSKQRSKGLEECGKYRKNTCCNETHIIPLRVKILGPIAARFHPECTRITEEMVCSACHPFIGTGKMRSICPSLCHTWYQACKNDFYTFGIDGSLIPCIGDALICSPLSAISINGGDFCERMGFQVGRNDDAEGIDCFDGSVPNELGEAEPTEPWQETMARLFEEQSKDPSGLFIIAIFIPLVALLLGRRVLRQWLDPNDLTGGSLSLEEVRRRQQQGYESRMNQDEVDSDTDSPFEEDDLNEEEKQQEMAVEPVSSSSSSSSS